MFRSVTKAVLIVTLASSIGLHWAFLQSLAWLGMVVTYSRDASITEAVAKTLDGRHPCALCKEIAKGKKSESKSELPAQVKKLEFSLMPAGFVFRRPGIFWWTSRAEFWAQPRPHAPPVPPPRLNLV